MLLAQRCQLSQKRFWSTIRIMHGQPLDISPA
jgi:hypothetical protein